jgi:hypothetical protein
MISLSYLTNDQQIKPLSLDRFIPHRKKISPLKFKLSESSRKNTNLLS